MSKYYIFKSPHGYTVGEGTTKASALEDAYGEKKYWSASTKRNIRDGWFEEKTKFEADEALGRDANKDVNLPAYFDEEMVGGNTGDPGVR
tara:strand:- start:86 stop:355 length:270 start_codon:yes stop_codon:yes gene_type:complete